MFLEIIRGLKISGTKRGMKFFWISAENPPPHIFNHERPTPYFVAILIDRLTRKDYYFFIAIA